MLIGFRQDGVDAEILNIMIGEANRQFIALQVRHFDFKFQAGFKPVEALGFNGDLVLRECLFAGDSVAEEAGCSEEDPCEDEKQSDALRRPTPSVRVELFFDLQIGFDDLNGIFGLSSALCRWKCRAWGLCFVARGLLRSTRGTGSEHGTVCALLLEV